MSYKTFKVELYKRAGAGWSTTANNISGFFNPTVRTAINDKKDSFSFNILNNNNQYFGAGSTFENGDRIVISSAINTSTIASSDALIDGVILNVVEDISTNNTLRIEGKNRTEMFLEGLCFVTSSIQKTPPEILEASLNFYNAQNGNFHITWSATNPSVKSDTTAFPTYYVADFYKPMNVVFERYSSNEYTQDGNYFYYINLANELVWAQMSAVSVDTIEETDCQKISIGSKGDQIVNSLVVYCGQDAYSNGIRAYAFDWGSRGKNGAKWKPMTSTNDIATTLMDEEKRTNASDFDDDSSWFPKSSSYPYTTSWGVSCADDDEYNAAIRAESKNRGLTRGQAYLNGRKDEVLSLKVTLPFTKSFSLGTVVTCNFPTYNLIGRGVRIHGIDYDSYSTTLILKEDDLII